MSFKPGIWMRFGGCLRDELVSGRRGDHDLEQSWKHHLTISTTKLNFGVMMEFSYMIELALGGNKEG